jgi:RimJ/RimL family protein N-acetyltransferase
MNNQIDQRDIFLKGKHVFLKCLTRNDVINSNWYGWFNDKELCKTLQKHYFPSTMESQMDFFESYLLKSNTKLQLGICIYGTSDIIGVISLNNIDYINRKCEFSIVIGEKKQQNLNIFIESTNLIFNHAFNTLNLNKIYGGTISKDFATLMCRFLNCSMIGVTPEEIYKEGVYHDSYLYSILKKDFNQNI